MSSGYGSAMPHIQSPECPCQPRVEEVRTADGKVTSVTYHHHDYETGREMAPPAMTA